MLLGRHVLRLSRPLISSHRSSRCRCLSLQRVSASTAAAVASKIKLRPYQEESIQAVLDHLEQGHKRLGLSLATGSGKTVVFTQLIQRIPSTSPKRTQTLILAHRQELVDQAYRHCKLAYPDLDIEIELAKQHASGVADITVASMQSIVSNGRIEKFDPSRFKLVLVDEAHHIVSRKYLEILDHFNLRDVKDDSPTLVGVSATMSRHDGLKLGAAIDYIVYHKDYVEMIDESWLSQIVLTTVRLKSDLSQVKTGVGGDFQTKSLSLAVNTPENNMAIYHAWLTRASKRKSTLIFCIDVNHIKSLTEVYRSHNVKAEYVTGTTKTARRHEILDSFKRGDFPVLLNCGVFTEGTDIPNIDCVILARPTRSQNLLVQMIGRGTRLHIGKENCHIIDMVSALKTGIVTTPTLFGLDPDTLMDKATIEDMKERRFSNRDESDPAASAAVMSSSGGKSTLEFTDYDSIDELLGDSSGERHIRALSQHAWVQVDDGRTILSSQEGYITITRSKDTEHNGNEAASDSFEVTYTRKLPGISKAPWARPQHIAQADTLTRAVHAADTFAQQSLERRSILTRSTWRQSPASPAQIKFLNSKRGRDGEYEYTEDDGLTKGRANDMITKIMFGARGRWKSMEGRKRKVLREAEGLKKSLEKIQVREKVKVGWVER